MPITIYHYLFIGMVNIAFKSGKMKSSSIQAIRSPLLANVGETRIRTHDSILDRLDFSML